MAGPVTKAARLESRGLAAFQQAHSDLLEAARLQGEEAVRQREIARDAALAAEVLKQSAEENVERAEQLADLLRLP